jgi:hypothetical protein
MDVAQIATPLHHIFLSIVSVCRCLERRPRVDVPSDSGAEQAETPFGAYPYFTTLQLLQTALPIKDGGLGHTVPS